jgi:hypothetical protein
MIKKGDRKLKAFDLLFLFYRSIKTASIKPLPRARTKNLPSAETLKLSAGLSPHLFAAPPEGF